jgi:hypothetical protein
MGSHNMDSTKRRSKGFTLIATLLLLLLLSGIAIGMLMMVNTEAKVGTQDVQNNTTFHAAEGAIEKMTSDLAGTFQNIESPTVSQITGLSALAPANTAFLKYPVYTLTPATTVNVNGVVVPQTSFGQISSGPYQGLSAELLPVTLQATAQGPLGDEVNMSRTVQVALIPVFQFGIYSDSDLSFFAGVKLDFNGRVHTNGDLYLAAGDGTTVTFHDKITAWGNVIRWAMPNGTLNANTGHNGNVDILTTPQGCDGVNPPVTTCRPMLTTEDSVTVGAAPNTWTTGGQNGAWPGISAGSANYNSWVIDGNVGLNGGTGAKQLTLPFVNGTNGNATSPQAFEIVRRPPAGELSTSLLGAARLYNEASIRVLLVDDPRELPGGANDANNIRLANYKDPDNGLDYSHGVAASVPAGLPALGAGDFYTTYFATASSGIADPTNWSQASSNPIPVDWLTGPLFPPPVVTLYDPSGLNQAPYMVKDPANNAVTKAPGLSNLDLCVPSTPVVVPPAAGPPVCDGVAAYPYYSMTPYNAPPLTLPYPIVPANTSTWNLLDGYLRVEYRDAGGVYHPVTQEWLGLGFARGSLPPTAAGANPINPNAILLLQEPADRNRDGVLDSAGAPPNYTSACTKRNNAGACIQTTYTPFPGKPPEVTIGSGGSPWYGHFLQAAGQQSPSQYNWYPINFYDAREGEGRDVRTGDQTCTPLGIMNSVELDVGNLRQWLLGNTGASGGLVDFASQNGYVLYFSDRRGMLPSPNGTQVDPAGTKTGDSGFEDVVNLGSQIGTPDGVLQPLQAGKTQSAEDVNNNTKLDAFGGANLGLGLGYVPTAPLAGAYTAAQQVNSLVNAGAVDNPYLTTGRIQPTCWIAQNNWISGARHVLRLVDGTLGNLPVRPDLAFPNSGGFTVGSENPVYIYGDYNSNPGDTIWGGGADQPHAAAGVIADAVTVLSNNWSDWASLASPSNDGGRPATTTYYRTAVASGKNINFSIQGLGWAVGDFGTDGGLHNFLRLLENWGGQTLNYNGSMVSMFYATYATGTDKNGGGTTYEPPIRNYTFDADFTQPQNLPPGTPMFRDIDNLSYRQSFSPCASVVNGVCTN